MEFFVDSHCMYINGLYLYRRKVNIASIMWMINPRIRYCTRMLICRVVEMMFDCLSVYLSAINFLIV